MDGRIYRLSVFLFQFSKKKIFLSFLPAIVNIAEQGKNPELNEPIDNALRPNYRARSPALDDASFVPWGPDVESSDLEFDYEIGDFFI